MKTLFTQMMLDRGYLATPTWYITLAHTEAIVSEYHATLRKVFAALAKVLKLSLEQQDAASALAILLAEIRGPLCHDRSFESPWAEF